MTPALHSTTGLPAPRRPARRPALALPLALALAPVLALWSPSPAGADIFSYSSRDGIIHFTNIPQPGRPWRRIMRTGPGKAGQVHARRSTRPLPPDRSRRYEEDIQQAAALYQIPPLLIHAVIGVESDYDPRATSQAGAQGLMQLMPATARGMGVIDVFDPRENIFGGVRYLRALANQFAGSLVKTIAGYHAGPGAVLRYGGLPPYATTLQYVRMVLHRYRRQRQRALATAPLGACPEMSRAARAQGAASTGAERTGWYVSTGAQPQRGGRVAQQFPDRLLGAPASAPEARGSRSNPLARR